MNKKTLLRQQGREEVSRREFLRKGAIMAGSAVAANALGELLVSAPAFAAQVDASDPALISGDVRYSAADGVGLTGYLTRPKGDDKRPAVIVIHGWTGIDDHIRDVGRRLAKAGYVALVPDLLARSGGTSAFSSGETATKELYRLGDEMFTKDLSGAVNYLNGQNFVRVNKIGVIGFCWGGGKALMFTTRSKDLAASVIYYGSNPPNLDDVKNISAPVLGQYGGVDERVTAGVPQLEAAMRKYGKSFEYKIYPGAPHAFNTDTSPRSYREDAAKEAWARTLEFLKKHLQS
jgi:carboxymethylenebutenolidase